MAAPPSALNPEISERSYTFYLAVLSQLFLVLFLYGFVSLLWVLYKAAAWVNVYITRTSSLPRYLHGRRYGAWALVTGASDGIGRAYASALAADGFNVVLHGRNEAKLAVVVAELAQRHPEASFRHVVADAANSHGMRQAIERIAESVAALPGGGPLTVLVNNIGGIKGIVPRIWYFLDRHSHAQVDAELNLNVRFGTQLTRALLPTLVAHKPALILNAGSVVGSFGMPHMCVYSGTKAFVERWSQALAQELAIEGHDIECLHVYFGKTTGTSASADAESLMLPSADTAARGALHKVGCGRSVVAACVGAWTAGRLLAVLPEWAVKRMFRSIALEGMAEEAREAKRQ